MTATPTCQPGAERFSTRLRMVSARSADLAFRRERPGESAAGARAGRDRKRTRWAGNLTGTFSSKMRTPNSETPRMYGLCLPGSRTRSPPLRADKHGAANVLRQPPAASLRPPTSRTSRGSGRIGVAVGPFAGFSIAEPSTPVTEERDSFDRPVPEPSGSEAEPPPAPHPTPLPIQHSGPRPEERAERIYLELRTILRDVLKRRLGSAALPRAKSIELL